MKIFLTVAAMVFLLNGCVPTVVSGATTGGKLLVQDKTVGEAMSDSTIWAKIRAGFIHKNLDSLVG